MWFTSGLVPAMTVDNGRGGGYAAHLRIKDGQECYLGASKDPVAAAQLYDMARAAVYGDTSVLNVSMVPSAGQGAARRMHDG